MNARQSRSHADVMTWCGSLVAMIRARSTPRTMLVLLGLLLAFAPAFVMLESQLGGVTPPESLFGYGAEQAYRTFDAEGAGGRRFHLIFEVIDFFMIPVYALLYATTIAYTGHRLFGRDSRMVGIMLILPLVASLIDYAENAVLITLLIAYPQQLSGLASIAGLLTAEKWTFLTASVGLGVVGLIGTTGQTLLRMLVRRQQPIVRHVVEVQRRNLPRPPLTA